MEWQNYKKLVIQSKTIEKHKKIIQIKKEETKKINFTPEKLLPIKIMREVPIRALNDKRSVEKKLVQSLGKGKEKIDLTVDLHGFSREAAYRFFLSNFVRALENGYRILLVITGKGQVLRSELESWLREPQIAQAVFYFCHAGPRQGAEGAFYLALRQGKK